MPRLRLSLLVRLVLTLAATGLLPLTISFYQLRVNKNALLTQLQNTHMFAARTAARSVEAFLRPARNLAQTVAQTAIHQEARSQAMQELLSGTLQASPGITAIGIFNSRGEEVIKAQRADSRGEIELSYSADAPPLELFQGPTKRWVRIAEELPDEIGQVVLIADAQELEGMITASPELGEEALLVLADRDGTALMGADLSVFPSESVALALSGKVRSSSNKYQGPETKEDIVVAHAGVAATTWVVLSRQPTRMAEAAQRRIRQAAWLAALLALLLTAGLSGLAHSTVIRPLRRLLRAQQKLLGTEAAAGGSEIAQLEESFALLEQRVRDSEELGKIVLGRYEVKKVLGSGAMGTVWKSWDPQLERDVAIKTVKLEAEEERREKLIKTLLKEAKTSAKFHHPNIVTTYDAAHEGAAAFIAMEFVDGITLEQLIATEGRIDWRQVVPLAAAVARGLAAAHERQLVHQDVKPANILLGRDGSIKVTDFGISELISSASATDGVVCGTPGYIAPECLEGAGYSPKSDLFALGTLLHECLTGEHPFAGRTLRITIVNTLNKAAGPLDRAQPDIPQELAELIYELIEKNPGRRPADAESVARVCERLAIELELQWALSPSSLQPPSPRGHRSMQAKQLFSVRSTRLLATRQGEA